MSIEVKNMKTLHLAVVCPVSGLPQNTEQARQAVWAEVTGLLQPNLGKFYSSFYPASSANLAGYAVCVVRMEVPV